MSTAELERTSTETSAGEARGLPEGSLTDSLRFVATGLLPAVARGLFSPRPRAMKWLTRLNTDGRAIKVLDSIRAKHGGEGVRLLRGKMTVLWGESAIREVLDNSATKYASDAGAKKKGMSHFQPDALTLSRGEQWRDRRKFNEFVLATSEKEHPQAARIRDVVADEVSRLRIGDGLEWKHWEQLFDHITLRVIFGNSARNDQELTDLLEKLMGRANRIVGGGPGEDYFEFYGRIDHYLANPDPYSLIAMVADAPQSDQTRIAQQIPHWMFAMRDTLGANAYRALALAASGHRDNLPGVLHEAMRLWPTTPLLAREKVDDESQVMILNVFNHRDPREADFNRVRPDREGSYRFNHLSNGSQDCPGGPLVMLIGTAVLEQMLSTYDLRYIGPSLDPPPEMLDFFSIRFDVG
jgi:cytochrome P450